MTDTKELIAEARDYQSRGRLYGADALYRGLADALEASEARIERLRAVVWNARETVGCCEKNCEYNRQQRTALNALQPGDLDD